jgi:hypothetical protein
MKWGPYLTFGASCTHNPITTSQLSVLKTERCRFQEALLNKYYSWDWSYCWQIHLPVQQATICDRSVQRSNGAFCYCNRAQHHCGFILLRDIPGAPHNIIISNSYSITHCTRKSPDDACVKLIVCIFLLLYDIWTSDSHFEIFFLPQKLQSSSTPI